MKILIATFNFPPAVGGVEEVARTQAAGLAARGHEVTVATSLHPQRTPAHVPPGVTLKEFDIAGSFLVGNPYRGDIAAYQDFIATTPVDIMLLHAWQSWAVDVALPVLARSSAKKIMVSHGFDGHLRKASPRFPWGFGSWLRARPYVWRLPRVMKAFDRLVFLSGLRDSGRFYDALLAHAVCPERVEVIPNGVHLAELRRTRPDFRKTFGIDTRLLVLNVANYNERKNQLATLSDFMPLNRDDATLVFIGSEFNAYHTELVREHDALRARFPKARVRFLEKISREAIHAAYQAADIFVLSAKFETQPLAILDAMAAGAPFVSTDVGCVRELPGGVVAPSGPETTAALNRLMEDERFRRELSAQGRTACEAKYDWERVLDAYEALFATLRR